MTLTEVALRLQGVLGERAAVVGGICGAILGVERFTHDVDFATDLDADAVQGQLEAAGLATSIARSNDPADLPWVVGGELADIPFQILPSARMGIDVAGAVWRAGLRVPSAAEIIVSKCRAGGQEDLHDVAVLCLLQPELLESARQTAAAEGVSEKLETWLDDRRFRRRYGNPRGRSPGSIASPVKRP